jgi:hypothetical protein
MIFKVFFVVQAVKKSFVKICELTKFTLILFVILCEFTRNFVNLRNKPQN